MASTEVAVKKYVVRLSGEERARLEEFIGKGKRAAHLSTRARILLKADVSEAGDGWSDSRIAQALDTSIATVERARRLLVEEGFEAVLTRKSNPNSARRRIFDGEAEAKLIALACGPAPAGRAKWTLRLLEEKVVELQIVESASDNTIGRTLKKTFSSPISGMSGRRPVVKGLVEALRTLRVRSCLRPVGAGWDGPAGPDAGPHGSSPDPKERAYHGACHGACATTGFLSQIRWFTSLRRRPRCGSPCGESAFLQSLFVQAATGRSS